MTDHGASESGQRFLGNLDRAGNEKFVVRQHAGNVSSDRPSVYRGRVSRLEFGIDLFLNSV